MRQYLDLLSHIRKSVDEAVVDAMSVELGFEDVVLVPAHYNNCNPDEFVREHTLLESQYMYKKWPEAKEEIIQHIGAIKDNEVELGHFIHGLLSYLQPVLEMFYPPYSYDSPYLTHDIVSVLFGTCGQMKAIPWQLREYHERDVDECIEAGIVDMEPDERADEIERRCYQTLKRINQRKDLACYQMCRYFHFLFKDLACVIESTLLEYHCKKDLYGYQVDYDIVLFPKISAADIADERNWTMDYVINLADGYDLFDRYTEFAGYGNVGSMIFFNGADFVKIPEIDALLFQLKEGRKPDYPGYHATRNYRRFERRCVEMASSDYSIAHKKAWVVSIVQLLGHCYQSFLEKDKLKHYSIFALSYFSVLEASFLKAPTQICVKEICQELSMEFLLTDPFPAEYAKGRSYLNPDEPWEHYLITRKLRSQYDYQMKRLCKDCTNATCSFRKHIPLQIVVNNNNPAPMKTKKEQFGAGLRQLCRSLAGRPGSKIQKTSDQNTWSLPHNGPLYAYIGVAMAEHCQLNQVPWKEMFPILTTKSDSAYLKGQASKLKSAIKNKNYSALPDGYKDVNAAVRKLSA